MSGSGNDFVFLDSRGTAPGQDALESTAEIAALCAPHLGVGADGVVFIGDDPDARFSIRYYNADGSRASLCGNASLCAAQSAVLLGLAGREERFRFRSDAGLIDASIDAAGGAAVRLAAVQALETDAAEALETGELRLGYAVVGVPHLVVRVHDVAAVDVFGRGRALRQVPSRQPAGANVNFVSRRAGQGADAGAGAAWAIRTYERGVEAETLACGTGSVATAACLVAWGEADSGGPVRLETASGRTLSVRFPEAPEWAWSELAGEGRLVFEGVLRAHR
ncbi:MAG: diaminopimelate epimerase [Gemmatimonadaceae bacterium]|nr:diaminopimelate epimerase [Gemmatimonadaceae bacterium]